LKLCNRGAREGPNGRKRKESGGEEDQKSESPKEGPLKFGLLNHGNSKKRESWNFGFDTLRKNTLMNLKKILKRK